MLHNFKILQEAGFEISNSKFHDIFIGELINQVQQNIMLYFKLKKLKKAISKEVVKTKGKVEAKAENGAVEVKEEVITAEESENKLL